MSRSQNQLPVRHAEREPNSDLSRAEDRLPQMSAARQWITNEMRRLYNDVVNEPLPESFKDLVNKLDTAEEPEKRAGENNVTS
jgi:hypothetical protein